MKKPILHIVSFLLIAAVGMTGFEAEAGGVKHVKRKPNAVAKAPQRNTEKVVVKEYFRNPDGSRRVVGQKIVPVADAERVRKVRDAKQGGDDDF